MQEPRPASLKKLAIRGTFWTMAGYGSNMAIRFGGNLALTRLLAPEIFGLMALVRTFVDGLELFSDVGLQPNIVRSKRGEEAAFLNTAWTIQVLRGFAIEIASLIIAWPVARYYGESSLLWFIPVLGMATLIRSFASTAVHVLSKRLQVGRETLLRLVRQIAGLIVMIGWAALIDSSVWALVIGSVVGSATYTILSHFIVPKDIPPSWFAWEKEAATEIFSFGRWIFISTILTFLESQVDRLILGKLLTFEQLGIYTLAFFISNIPQQIIRQWSRQVLMPVFSKKVDMPRAEIRAKFWKPRLALTMSVSLLISILAVFADVFVEFLYDDRYQQAGWILSLLAFGIWPRVLTETINPLLLMLGKPGYAAFGNLLKVAYLFAFLPPSFHTYGFLGVAVVMAFNDVPFYLALQVGLVRERLSLFLQDILLTVLALVPLALTTLFRVQLGLGLPFSEVPGIHSLFGILGS